MTTRTNYIFVDFENTQDIDLELIAGKPVKVFLILGGKQERLPVALVKTLLKYSSQIQVIETEQTGNHALDFVLACQIGAQAITDPNGYFHILSKDKGFDAVIRHLKEQDVLGARHTEFSKIPVLLDATRLSPADRVNLAVERFLDPKCSRPSRRRTLLNHINTFFQNQLSEDDLERIAKGLVAAKVCSITDAGKVIYPENP